MVKSFITLVPGLNVKTLYRQGRTMSFNFENYFRKEIFLDFFWLSWSSGTQAKRPLKEIMTENVSTIKNIFITKILYDNNFTLIIIIYF